MSIIRAALPELYTSIYDSMMLQTFNEYESGCMQAFKEIDTKQKNYIVNDVSGLGMWESVDEMVEVTPEDPVQGYSKTYTIGDIAKRFQVSFNAIDDDEYALLKKEGDASNMGKGARARMSYDVAQALYNMFSVAGPDGQYGIDLDHPKNAEETGTTYSNLLSGAFSHDALEDAETQISSNLYDPKGLPIPVTQDPILLYPPALRGKVLRVLSERAVDRPGVTNRDVNQFAVRRGVFQYKPVECVWLNAANGGSDTAWYICLPWMGFLKFVWRQKPAFVSWTDYEIRAYNFQGIMRYAVGYDNWRGVFGSTGL